MQVQEFLFRKLAPIITNFAPNTVLPDNMCNILTILFLENDRTN